MGIPTLDFATETPANDRDVSADVVDVPADSEGEGLQPVQPPIPRETTNTQTKTPVEQDDVDDDGSADDDSGEAWFKDDLAQRAQAYGITPEQAQGFGSADNLERAIQLWDQRMLASGRQVYAQQYPQYQQQFQPPQQQGQQQTQQQPGEKPKFELDPDEVGEGVAKTFHGMRDHYEQQIAQLNARFDQNQLQQQQEAAYRQQQYEQQQLQAYYGELTVGIKGLGDEYKDLLGEPEKLHRTDPKLQNVSVVDQQVRLLLAGYLANGQNPPPVSVLVKSAVATAFPEHTKQTAIRGVNRQIDSRQRRSTGRAAPAAKDKGRTGTERAVKRHENFLKEHGGAGGIYDDDEAVLAGLPG